MFSSNPLSTTNVFSPPNSFFAYEKDDVPFNYRNQIYNCPPPVTTGEVVLQQQFSEGSGFQYSEDHDDLLDSVVSSYKKTAATSKKDGHSKIHTARGPRDRRVRLSIDISRKFFCLQDLLGFDKASKTLDWLLTKSLSAIKDLVEQTNHCSSSTVTDEESKARFLESIKGAASDEKSKKQVLKCVVGKGKKTSEIRSKLGENFSREQSRAEARARARERTKEKNLSNFQAAKRFKLSD